MQEYEWFRSNK